MWFNLLHERRERLPADVRTGRRQIRRAGGVGFRQRHEVVESWLPATVCLALKNVDGRQARHRPARRETIINERIGRNDFVRKPTSWVSNPTILHRCLLPTSCSRLPNFASTFCHSKADSEALLTTTSFPSIHFNMRRTCTPLKPSPSPILSSGNDVSKRNRYLVVIYRVKHELLETKFFCNKIKIMDSEMFEPCDLFCLAVQL